MSLVGWSALLPALVTGSRTSPCRPARTATCPARSARRPGGSPRLCLAFLLAAICEEVGWTRFLTLHLLPKWTVVRTGVVVGALWAGLHVIPYAQADRSWGWIAS